MDARLRRIRVALFTLAAISMSVGLVGFQAGGAAPARLHPEARAAIDALWSPYCPGMMLEVCPSPSGAMLRDSIARMAGAGLEADSIIELVLADYGEEYRAAPRMSGTGGRRAWLIPPAALLAGLAVVGIVLARRRRLRVEATLPPPSPDESGRLAAAMAALDDAEAPDF